jgi:hypothetical protein
VLQFVVLALRSSDEYEDVLELGDELNSHGGRDQLHADVMHRWEATSILIGDQLQRDKQQIR